MQTYRHTAQHTLSGLAWAGYPFMSHRKWERLPSVKDSMWSGVVNESVSKNIYIYLKKKNSSSCSLKFCFIFLGFADIILNLYLFSIAASFFFLSSWRLYHPTWHRLTTDFRACCQYLQVWGHFYAISCLSDLLLSVLSASHCCPDLLLTDGNPLTTAARPTNSMH